MNFADITEAVRSEIANHATFYGLSTCVFRDEGESQPGIETSLRDNGLAVIVNPVLLGDLISYAKGRTVLNASVMVRVQINPGRISQEGAAGIGIYDAVAAVHAAVIGCSVDRGDVGFVPDDPFYVLAANDRGLLAMDLFFVKLCNLN